MKILISINGIAPICQGQISEIVFLLRLFFPLRVRKKFDFTRRFVNKKAFTKGKIIDFSEIQKNRNKRGYVCWKRDHRKVSPAGPARREGSVGLPKLGEKKDKNVRFTVVRSARSGHEKTAAAALGSSAGHW